VLFRYNVDSGVDSYSDEDDGIPSS